MMSHCCLAPGQVPGCWSGLPERQHLVRAVDATVILAWTTGHSWEGTQLFIQLQVFFLCHVMEEGSWVLYVPGVELWLLHLGAQSPRPEKVF